MNFITHMYFSIDNNLYFQGRCPQIRDAQWVCHTINSNFPHVSTTRRIRAYKKIITGVPELKPTSKPLYSMKDILEALNFMKENRIFRWNKSEEFNQFFDIICYSIKSIEDVARARLFSEYISQGNKFLFALDMLKNFRRGNCYENSLLTEFLLKLNGIKNACIVDLKNPSQTAQHTVCVFNRDGSPFKKVVNNKTIIVDPWSGKADFANNLVPFYKYQCHDYFGIKPDEKLEFVFREQNDIPDQTLEGYSTKLPDIFFKNKKP